MTLDRRRLPSDRRRPVLILSHNPDVVDLYTLSWRSHRVGVVSVGSIAEAAHLLSARAIAAIVIDVSNPAVDWPMCRELVSASEEQLPVIVLTGWLDANTRSEALSSGCAAFVAKPASPERLLEIVQRTRAGERGIVAVP